MPDADSISVRLLCDLMIPPEISAAIGTQGYDVLEARTLLPEIQQDDWAILAEAAAQHRTVVTCNYSDPASNFCLIHDEWLKQSQPHFGIILIPQFQISSRLCRWEVRDRLLAFLNQHTAEELRNQLCWLPQW